MRASPFGYCVRYSRKGGTERGSHWHHDVMLMANIHPVRCLVLASVLPLAACHPDDVAHTKAADAAVSDPDGGKLPRAGNTAPEPLKACTADDGYKGAPITARLAWLTVSEMDELRGTVKDIDDLHVVIANGAGTSLQIPWRGAPLGETFAVGDAVHYRRMQHDWALLSGAHATIAVYDTSSYNSEEVTLVPELPFGPKFKTHLLCETSSPSRCPEVLSVTRRYALEAMGSGDAVTLLPNDTRTIGAWEITHAELTTTIAVTPPKAGRGAGTCSSTLEPSVRGALFALTRGTLLASDADAGM